MKDTIRAIGTERMITRNRMGEGLTFCSVGGVVTQNREGIDLGLGNGVGVEGWGLYFSPIP